MNQKKNIFKSIFTALAPLLLILSLFLASCTPVAPYERIYLNDAEMQLSQHSGSAFENYIHTIREGATVAGGTKTSGGCGCN